MIKKRKKKFDIDRRTGRSILKTVLPELFLAKIFIYFCFLSFTVIPTTTTIVLTIKF